MLSAGLQLALINFRIRSSTMLQRRVSRWALGVCLGFSALVLLQAAPLPAASSSGWAEVSPKDGGFAIQMPGTPKPD
jgi:hypothetical protein